MSDVSELSNYCSLGFVVLAGFETVACKLKSCLLVNRSIVLEHLVLHVQQICLTLNHSKSFLMTQGIAWNSD